MHNDTDLRNILRGILEENDIQHMNSYQLDENLYRCLMDAKTLINQDDNKDKADIKSLYNILIFQTIENTNNNQLKLSFTEYLKKHNMDEESISNPELTLYQLQKQLPKYPNTFTTLFDYILKNIKNKKNTPKQNINDDTQRCLSQLYYNHFHAINLHPEQKYLYEESNNIPVSNTEYHMINTIQNIIHKYNRWKTTDNNLDILKQLTALHRLFFIINMKNASPGAKQAIYNNLKELLNTEQVLPDKDMICISEKNIENFNENDKHAIRALHVCMMNDNDYINKIKPILESNNYSNLNLYTFIQSTKNGNNDLYNFCTKYIKNFDNKEYRKKFQASYVDPFVFDLYSKLNDNNNNLPHDAKLALINLMKSFIISEIQRNKSLSSFLNNINDVELYVNEDNINTFVMNTFKYINIYNDTLKNDFYNLVRYMKYKHHIVFNNELKTCIDNNQQTTDTIKLFDKQPLSSNNNNNIDNNQQTIDNTKSFTKTPYNLFHIYSIINKGNDNDNLKLHENLLKIQVSDDDYTTIMSLYIYTASLKQKNIDEKLKQQLDELLNNVVNLYIINKSNNENIKEQLAKIKNIKQEDCIKNIDNILPKLKSSDNILNKDLEKYKNTLYSILKSDLIKVSRLPEELQYCNDLYKEIPVLYIFYQAGIKLDNNIIKNSIQNYKIKNIKLIELVHNIDSNVSENGNAKTLLQKICEHASSPDNCDISPVIEYIKNYHYNSDNKEKLQNYVDNLNIPVNYIYCSKNLDYNPNYVEYYVLNKDLLDKTEKQSHLKVYSTNNNSSTDTCKNKCEEEINNLLDNDRRIYLYDILEGGQMDDFMPYGYNKDTIKSHTRHFYVDKKLLSEAISSKNTEKLIFSLINTAYENSTSFIDRYIFDRVLERLDENKIKLQKHIIRKYFNNNKDINTNTPSPLYNIDSYNTQQKQRFDIHLNKPTNKQRDTSKIYYHGR